MFSVSCHRQTKMAGDFYKINNQSAFIAKSAGAFSHKLQGAVALKKTYLTKEIHCAIRDAKSPGAKPDKHSPSTSICPTAERRTRSGRTTKTLLYHRKRRLKRSLAEMFGASCRTKNFPPWLLEANKYCGGQAYLFTEKTLLRRSFGSIANKKCFWGSGDGNSFGGAWRGRRFKLVVLKFGFRLYQFFYNDDCVSDTWRHKAYGSAESFLYGVRMTPPTMPRGLPRHSQGKMSSLQSEATTNR